MEIPPYWSPTASQPGRRLVKSAESGYSICYFSSSSRLKGRIFFYPLDMGLAASFNYIPLLALELFSWRCILGHGCYCFVPQTADIEVRYRHPTRSSGQLWRAKTAWEFLLRPGSSNIARCTCPGSV